MLNLTAGFELFYDHKVALADPKVKENAARYIVSPDETYF